MVHYGLGVIILMDNLVMEIIVTLIYLFRLELLPIGRRH